ncbi:chloride channel protein [Peterkaempfera griseoplana]|uniref:chloride channel protein n=1 Tax=Peterkaempfera griseoplana TaxID=66896 RepID=UPI0006E45ACD|nr:chloride channel protein [Peterkaempfera griseoplana]
MAQSGQAPRPAVVHEVFRNPGYLRLLLLSAAVGIPVSLVAFGFVALQHQMQHGVWVSLPHALGMAAAPWWWPLPCLTLGGLLVAWCVIALPGRGGHVAAEGFGGAPTLPSALPGVVLAALAGLSLGAVLGPEAPLMALGSGLALMSVRSAGRAATPQLVPVLGAAGSAAAISTILGSPLVAAVLMIEVAGIGAPQLYVVLLPSLLASGVGALVFTGFGHWTGLEVGSLALPLSGPSEPLDAGDLLWGVPLAAVTALGTAGVMLLARHAARWTGRRTLQRTVLCGVAVGVCAACYTLATGRPPDDVALSGQTTLVTLARDPHVWAVSTLVLLLLFKGVGWAISLGSFRGGPIFPSVLMGAALGVACSGLPGFGALPALAAGLTASSTAALRLPVSAVVLAALLLGKPGVDQIPLVVIAAVVSFVVSELLPGRTPAGADAVRQSPQPGRPSRSGP